MLKRLNIKNYVLIDEVIIDFSEGLSVLTGETGSGKSILLGALNLILGERADLDTLRNDSEKCVVEATFAVSASLQAFFESEDLDFEPETIVRREISPVGKSRAFINDTPVNLKTLKAFGALVVDIHSQMENSRLKENAFRFELLDAAAHQIDSIKTWQKSYRLLLKKQEELSRLIEQESKSKLDLDYYEFQLEELENAKLDTVDLETLEDEANTHRNAEEISASLAKVAHSLEDSDQAVLHELKHLVQSLSQTADLHRESQNLKERLNSCYIELQDIVREASLQCDQVEGDPARLAEIESVLDQIYALQNKHRLTSISELVELRNEVQMRVNSIGSLEGDLVKLREETQILSVKLKEEAKQLHHNREIAASQLQDEVESLLAELKMPHAHLEFELTKIDDLNNFGCSELRLLFTANLGAPPVPLEKCASGGELSRLTLALKAVISTHRMLPTLILDEIDTGVSGDVAFRMAEAMKQMADRMQLIAISHLPQVAGNARHHFKVLKETKGSQTYTRIHPLVQSERIEELASMLSGDQITESARDHAKVLLSIN